MIEAY